MRKWEIKKKSLPFGLDPQQTQGATGQKEGGRAVESNRQLRMLYTSVTDWEDNSPPPTEMGVPVPGYHRRRHIGSRPN